MCIKREREAHRLLQQIDTFQLHLFTAQLTLVKKQQAEANSNRKRMKRRLWTNSWVIEKTTLWPVWTAVAWVDCRRYSWIQKISSDEPRNVSWTSGKSWTQDWKTRHLLKEGLMAFARWWALVTAELICALGFKSSVTVMPKSMPILVTFRTCFSDM